MSQLKFQKGFPTKGSLQKFIESFDRKMSLHPGGLYTKPNGFKTLVWQCKYTQTRIDDFVKHAANHGLYFSKYQPYQSPTVGHLYIQPKNDTTKP